MQFVIAPYGSFRKYLSFRELSESTNRTMTGMEWWVWWFDLSVVFLCSFSTSFGPPSTCFFVLFFLLEHRLSIVLNEERASEAAGDLLEKKCSAQRLFPSTLPFLCSHFERFWLKISQFFRKGAGDVTCPFFQQDSDMSWTKQWYSLITGAMMAGLIIRTKYLK